MQFFMTNRIRTIVGITAASVLAAATAAGQEGSEAVGNSPSNAIATLDSLEATLKAGGSPDLSAVSGATDNATINLLRLLVKRGVVSHEDAVVLIRQAEQEAAYVSAQSEAVRSAADQIRVAAEREIEYNESDIRITYIPETVKEEIAEDVSHNVMDRARRESWVTQPAEDSWLSRLSLFADFRLRYEVIDFPSGNGDWGSFPNFNAINTGSPFDTTGAAYAPQINAWENRQRSRIRARFGFEAQLEDGLSMGMRLATGSSSSPVTTNQTLGSPGNFSRYQIWLDRAFLRWDYESDLNVSVVAGRFDNPFFSSEIIWDDDIGFDGIAVQLKYRVSRDTATFLTAGAFPVYNTSLNFVGGQTSNDASSFKSQDRYLFAVQGGIEHKFDKDIEMKFALGYYYFQNVQGQLSTEYDAVLPTDAGDTDGLRPTFAQKGNTYMRLRNIRPTAENNWGAIDQWQYFGLAAPFRVLSATGKIDFNHFEPFQISLFGEFVNNFGVSDSLMDEMNVVNNRDISGSTLGAYNGGGVGWIVGVSVGDTVLDERWKWRVGVDYRYMESDSFVDGFVGSDFGLGGTNLKGVSIGGKVALFRSVNLGMRWMSASEVSGPQFRSDVFQLDLSAEF